MINLPKLVRMASEGEHERMLDEVIRNGRPLPLNVRLRLQDRETLPAAALGLALSRVTELTYRPSDIACTLVVLLLERRHEDGSFGSVAATSIALAALHAMTDQIDALSGGAVTGRYIDPSLERSVRSAASTALHALVQAQNGANDESGDGMLGDEIDSAIALWRLGLDTRFARAVRYEALLAAVEDRGLRHSRATSSLLEPLAMAPRADQPIGRRRRSRSAAA